MGPNQSQAVLSLTSQARSHGRVGTTFPAYDAHAEPGAALSNSRPPSRVNNRMFAPAVSPFHRPPWVGRPTGLQWRRWEGPAIGCRNLRDSSRSSGRLAFLACLGQPIFWRRSKKRTLTLSSWRARAKSNSSAPNSSKLIFVRTQGAAWDIANGGGEGNGLDLYRPLKR